jgi:splicing factor U2AF subunit
MIPEETVVTPPPVIASMNPQQQRQQKRLYVGNLPATVSEIELMEFFNAAMSNANVLTSPGSPVLSATINREKAYAFIEFRSAEEASAGMSLDGITLQGNALRVRRPKDYQPNVTEVPTVTTPTSTPTSRSSRYDENLSLPPIPPPMPAPQAHTPVLSVNLNIVSTNVADTPYKIFIGGLPTHLNEGEVKKILSTFGQLKSFNLVRDSLTGLSKGFAFCEYADPSITDAACASLNGMPLIDKTLVVQRASVNPKTKSGEYSNEPINPRAANMLNLSTPAAQLLATAVKNATADPTRILVLMNIINLSDFPGDCEEGEYQEFIDDITEECLRYGKVLNILVPKPTTKQKNHTVEHFDGNDIDLDALTVDDEISDEEESQEEPPPPGFSKVFVEYEKVEYAKRAQTALSGRRYDGRMVITSFHPEDKWESIILEPDDIEPLYSHMLINNKI